MNDNDIPTRIWHSPKKFLEEQVKDAQLKVMKISREIARCKNIKARAKLIYQRQILKKEYRRLK